MQVFPREIVRGRAYLREVEAGLAALAAMPAIILWPDLDPGFGDAELARWQALFPDARSVPLRHDRQFIDEDAPDDIADASFLVARGPHGRGCRPSGVWGQTPSLLDHVERGHRRGQQRQRAAVADDVSRPATNRPRKTTTVASSATPLSRNSGPRGGSRPSRGRRPSSRTTRTSRGTTPRPSGRRAD